MVSDYDKAIYENDTFEERISYLDFALENAVSDIDQIRESFKRNRRKASEVFREFRNNPIPVEGGVFPESAVHPQKAHRRLVSCISGNSVCLNCHNFRKSQIPLVRVVWNFDLDGLPKAEGETAICPVCLFCEAKNRVAALRIESGGNALRFAALAEKYGRGLPLLDYMLDESGKVRRPNGEHSIGVAHDLVRNVPCVYWGKQ